MEQLKNNLKGKRILIFQQRDWSFNIGHFLAKKLQAEGCRLAALTFKNSAHEFVLNQKEVKYDLVINDDRVMGDPKKYLAGDDYSLAEICRELGVDSIWPMVSTVRFFVKSYKDKYYYSFRQNLPDEEIIEYVKAAYKYVKTFFTEFKPDIIIAPNFVNLTHIMFNIYAQKKGAKMIALTDCKIREHGIFIHDYNESTGAFYKRVDELNAGLAESKNREKAKEYIRDFRQTFKRPVSADALEKFNKKTWWQKIRHEVSPYYHIWRWYTKPPVNYMKNVGVSVDYRPPRIILRDHYCHKRYKKFLDNYNYYPLDKIKKFAYFPLQFQPESPTDVLAPFFSNQIETIRLTAMSLPDDYTLVVKEHPGMVGLRSPSYTEKVDRTPNVKLVDYRLSSEEILKRASMIINHNCTSFAEAAFYYKPAIQFGNLGTTLKLPNVFKHTDMTTLAGKIKEVLAVDLRTEAYERKLENYVAAVFDTGYEVNYTKIWRGDKSENKLEFLWQIYRKEMESVLLE
jgi:hypothetical protein